MELSESWDPSSTTQQVLVRQGGGREEGTWWGITPTSLSFYHPISCQCLPLAEQESRSQSFGAQSRAEKGGEGM